MYMNQIRKKSCAAIPVLFNGFGWNITLHDNKTSDINRKASRSVNELSIEPIFNLYFFVKTL